MTLLSDAPVRGVEPSVRTGLPRVDLQRTDGLRVDAGVDRSAVDALPGVDVHGPLDVHSLPRVRAALDDALRGRPSRLVVDLAECPHVDASGLAVLLDVHRRMCRYGGLLTLRGASPRVVRVLSLTGLRHVFHLA